MKILIITNYFPPYERGGGEDVAVLSADALSDMGHDVVILTAVPYAGWRSLWPRRSFENRIAVYRWFPLNLYYLATASKRLLVSRMAWTLIDMINLPAWLAVRAVLRREKPVVAMSHNIKGLGMLLPRAVSRTVRAYVHVVHDVQLIEPSGLLYDAHVALGWPSRVYGHWLRWCFQTVPVVVSPSQFLLSFYVTHGFFTHARTSVLLNPVASRTVARVPHGGLNVVFIGQLESHKGIDVLLEAWGKVNLEGRLLVAGDGAWRERVVEAAEKNSTIEYVGRVVRHEQSDLWSRADIVVVPSRCLENSPTVITEALVRGVAVVASRVGGIPELASLSANVHLVPPGDVDALVTTLQQTAVDVRAGRSFPTVSLPSATNYAQKLLVLSQAS